MPKLRHPNKHIRAALAYAEASGWRVEKAPPRAHPWGFIICPSTRTLPDGRTDGCRYSVWGTPQNPQSHARRIRRNVDACKHTD